MLAADTTRALGHFDRLLQEAPTQACALIVNIARIYNNRKQFEDVIRVLTISTNACPVDNNTPYCFYLIGTANFELGNIDASIVAMQRALEINPNYHFASIYLGDIFIHQKNVTEGEAQFNKVVDACKGEAEKFKQELNMAFGKICGIKLDQKKYNDLQRVARQ
jgi:tetratricopeptide (TPR) repeat protein